MKSTINFYLIVFFSVLLFVACGSEEQQSDGNGDGDNIGSDVSVNVASQLTGNWETVKVIRSGNETDMGPFSVEFNADANTFTSNIFDAKQEFPYENGVKTILNGYSLSFENLPDTFHIDNIDEQNLVLSSTIHNYPFEFIFEKK